MGAAAAHEEIVVCDLADRDAALEVTRDCDAIVHFAGHPREQSFAEIVADTLPGSYHMFEGARLNGARRVVYASSINAPVALIVARSKAPGKSAVRPTRSACIP